MALKVLHTSDWHLGRALHGRRRYDEFAAFLEWLSETIEAREVDILLIAGDIFDTTTPGNRAQELYYRFLARTAASCCRHVVIIGGNHDSPTFLDAPKQLLAALNVHIVGAAAENPADEVILLRDGEKPLAVICAVPYLRDRDIRVAVPGESIDEKSANLVAGLREHYTTVLAAARATRQQLIADNSGIPLICMGHLFVAGGATVEGDGVRDLYVGSLVHVGADIFADDVDYLALGHLHVPQGIAGKEHFRYSGSPVPMGFGEARQQKSVVLAEFEGRSSGIQKLSIPCFQELERISGSREEILTAIEVLKAEKSSAWLEITCQDTVTAGLREELDEAIADSALEIRLVKTPKVVDAVLQAAEENETLDALDCDEVFARCLDTFLVPEDERDELLICYQEILQVLDEEDIRAE